MFLWSEHPARLAVGNLGAVDGILCAVRACRGGGVMDGLPIETCPKDESEFLAYDPVAERFDVCVWWASPASMVGVHQTQIDCELGPDEHEFQAHRATLWWPLPKVHAPTA